MSDKFKWDSGSGGEKPGALPGVPGLGDVVGPAGVQEGNIAVFDGATGKLLKDGGGPLDSSADIDQSGGTADTYSVLAGAVNGINTDFTLSTGVYISGTLLLFRNGQLLTQGTGEDWVELSPAAGTLRFNTAPNATAQISAVVVIGKRGVQGLQGFQGDPGDPGTPAANSVHHQQLIWTVDGPYVSSVEVGVKPLMLFMAYVGAGATIEEVKVHCSTAPSTTNLRIRIKKNGATIFTGTDYVEIATGANDVSRTTGFASSGAAAKDDYFQWELVQGDAVAANVTIQLRYKWTLTGS